MRGFVGALAILLWLGSAWGVYQVDVPASLVGEACRGDLSARLQCADDGRWYPATSITGPSGHPAMLHLVFNLDEELKGRVVGRVEISAAGVRREWKPGKWEAIYSAGASLPVSGRFRGLGPCANVKRAEPLHVQLDPLARDAVLRVELAKPGQIRLDVLDLLGNPVEEIRRGQLGAGIHWFRFRGRNLPGGLYLVKLEADGQRTIRKLVLP